ncbi:helix-turn-helix domain-containing protein [Ekhidna sp.]|uniref:helix-turn-helix domain-containing protein n=1 Tax=Ekhidna sp. TaxID=2608089 RepID=UPI0032976DE1
MDKNQFVKLYYSVLNNSELNDLQKLLLSMIIALSKKEGYSYANNHYFAERLHKSKSTITRNISDIESKGFIRTEVKLGQRKIFVDQGKIDRHSENDLSANLHIAMSKNAQGPEQKRSGTMSKNAQDNREENKELNKEKSNKTESTSFAGYGSLSSNDEITKINDESDNDNSRIPLILRSRIDFHNAVTDGFSSFFETLSYTHPEHHLSENQMYNYILENISFDVESGSSSKYLMEKIQHTLEKGVAHGSIKQEPFVSDIYDPLDDTFDYFVKELFLKMKSFYDVSAKTA